MPEATREEFEQYENFMAKKIRKGKQNFMAKKIRKGKQKRKKRASGRAAASEQRGGSPSREPPDEPDRKRRRRAVIVGAPCEVADEICSPFSKMHRPGRRPPPTKAVCVRKLLAGFRPPVFLEPL